MSKRTELSSILILLSLTQINANHDLFTDFVSNVLVDNQFSDGFFSELLAAKYIFEHDRKYFKLFFFVGTYLKFLLSNHDFTDDFLAECKVCSQC